MGTRRARKEIRIDAISLTMPPKCSQSTVTEFPLRSLKKFRRNSQNNNCHGFETLHSDLVLSTLVFLASTASTPADLINTMLVCKSFLGMVLHPLVLANVSHSALAVKASRWSESAHRFLKRCADSGNAEACYLLGMIRFYCLGNTAGGASLMAKAALASHVDALYSLGVIQFNGSGGTRKDKNLTAGVALCQKAASLGHVDAMRELGHCLQDGYGVMRNIFHGRRLLLEANAREATAAVSCSRDFIASALRLNINTCQRHLCVDHWLRCHASQNKHESSNNQLSHLISPIALHGPPCYHTIYRLMQSLSCSLLSDFGCNVPHAHVHTANIFLVNWFTIHPLSTGLRLCSHASCGRPEFRRHEFRRCSACGKVNYCSRACQALDWKIRHKYNCQPVQDWEDADDNYADEGTDNEGNNDVDTHNLE